MLAHVDTPDNDLRLQTWPINKLVRYENNPRNQAPEKVAQLAEAIKKFGFQVPVLARPDGLLVDGHFRLKAAEKLGLESIPVIVTELEGAELRAFRISVNRMAELASWDEDSLLRELEDLKEDGFALGEHGPVGFDLEERGEEALEEWDFSPTKDAFVVTITGSLPLEADVRERLKGLEGVTIEASVLQKGS